MTVWQPDFLGNNFEYLTLPLGKDSDNELVATLVRSLPRQLRWYERPAPLAHLDILYLHGYSDYFFQTHVADFFTNLGARFFALDLRHSGRSLRPGQRLGYVEDLQHYDEDIAAARSAIAHSPLPNSRTATRQLVLLGHSTGGLVASLWAQRHPSQVAALILNSPWLEFQGTSIGRNALTPLVSLSAHLDPLQELPTPDFGFYSRSVSNKTGGQWDVNEAWRPTQGRTANPGWLKAIFEGQERVAAGLNLPVPILTFLSSHSMLQTRWSEQMRFSDTVLNVEEVAKRCINLGPHLTIERLNGALHDVFLSTEPVLEAAFAHLKRWLAYALPAS